MKELRFTVLPSEGGTRLDQFVAAHEPSLSRARAHQLIAEGNVLVDAKAAKPALRLRAGNDVGVRIPAPRAVELIPQDLHLRSLYEDEHLIVIDKPPGISVHPGAGGGGATLVHGLLHRIADLRGIGGELRPGIVHRLDKDTSGCLVVAKSEGALQGLQAAFKAREVEKSYLAIAHGQLEESGELDTLYARHPVDRKRFSSKVKSGKRAVTRWRVLARSAAPKKKPAAPRRDTKNDEPAASVLEVDLLTGRTHQIRAHFADRGHPLLGDVLYGGAKREGKLSDESSVKRAAVALGRQALHAWVLEFQHPITHARISCTSPIPADLRAALELLSIDAKSLHSSRGKR